MNLNHIHLRVRELNAAVNWFKTILELQPGFQNEHMATLSFGQLTIILDSADVDVVATVGFESDDCDRDFQTLMERGTVSLEPPTNKNWGVRTAYIKGPGGLRLEIEGPTSDR